MLGQLAVLLLCSGAARPTPLQKLIQALEVTPTISELVDCRDSPSKVGEATKRIAARMAVASRYSTANLRSALTWLYDRARASDALKRGRTSLAEYRSAFRSGCKQYAQESPANFAERLADTDIGVAEVEFWVDRTLFYLPNSDQATPRKAFYRSGLVIGGSIDRESPVSQDAGEFKIDVSRLVRESQPHLHPDEFDFYSKYFARKPFKILDPVAEFTSMRRLLTEMLSCPTVLDYFSAIRPGSDGTELRNLRSAVKQHMRAISRFSVPDISRALDWLEQRRSMAATVCVNPEMLLQYRSLYPCPVTRKKGEPIDQLLDRIESNAEAAETVEVWIDRFLFDASTTDPLQPWKDPRMPYYLDPKPVFFSQLFSKITSGTIDRSSPVVQTRSGPEITAATTGQALSNHWENLAPGSELLYYAAHFRRRRKI